MRAGMEGGGGDWKGWRRRAVEMAILAVKRELRGIYRPAWPQQIMARFTKHCRTRGVSGCRLEISFLLLLHHCVPQLGCKPPPPKKKEKFSMPL